MATNSSEEKLCKETVSDEQKSEANAPEAIEAKVVGKGLEHTNSSEGKPCKETVSDEQKGEANAPETTDTKVVEKASEHPPTPLQKFSLLKVVEKSAVTVLVLSSMLLIFKNFTSPSTQTSHWFLFAGLIIVTFISLTISFWNYHVRTLYLKDGPALAPEKWGIMINKAQKELDKVRKELKESRKELNELLKQSESQQRQLQGSVKKHSEDQVKKSDVLLENFLTLQKALDSRDEEIARLKKGYDAKIFKRFLFRFVRVDRALREMENEFSGQENQKNYRYLSRTMRDALEECGVEEFTPEIGSDYRDADHKIADDPKELKTEDADKDFTVAAVESVAYILKGEGDEEVVVPSKVKIFRSTSSEKEKQSSEKEKQ